MAISWNRLVGQAKGNVVDGEDVAVVIVVVVALSVTIVEVLGAVVVKVVVKPVLELVVAAAVVDSLLELSCVDEVFVLIANVVRRVVFVVIWPNQGQWGLLVGWADSTGLLATKVPKITSHSRQIKLLDNFNVNAMINLVEVSYQMFLCET